MDRTVVDLTSSSPSAELPHPNIFPWDDRRQLPQSSQAPHTSKRRRLNHDPARHPPAPSPSFAAASTSRNPPVNINHHLDVDDLEAVDLTGANDKAELSKTVSKQQEDAVKAQQQQVVDSEESQSILAAYKCPVCMDTPVDATSTVCGHLFCHTCIVDTLRFGEERRAHEGNNKTPRGNCPVCRKPLSRVDNPGPRRNLVPLQLKLTTKKKS